MPKVSPHNSWKLWIIRVVFALCATCSGPSFSVGYAGYVVTDLGPAPPLGELTGINNHGQLIGNNGSNGGFALVYTSDGWIYSGGNWTHLLPPGGSTFVHAAAISDSGVVVGAFSTGNCVQPYCPTAPTAFVASNGTFTDLGLLGGQTSAATGVNSLGTVVGNSQYAWQYAGGLVTPLNLFGGQLTKAVGINTAGTIAGNLIFADGTTLAFLDDHGMTTALGTLGGSSTNATAINQFDQVAGSSTTADDDRHAFLYSNGSMTDLGTLGGSPSGATGINAAGQVVGYSATFNGQYSRFLYSDGRMTDLASLIDPSTGDWAVLSVGGINDVGQMPVIACTPGNCHVLLLSPATTVVEYQNTEDFPGSPGGHFFYTDNPGEQAIVDSGADGHFVRTGRTFNSGGPHPLCRFYGSVTPGPNSHFYTISDAECEGLIAIQQTPIPANTPQWNYEGVAFTGTPPQSGGHCPQGTTPVYRAYNTAYPAAGPKNPWDSAHRFSTDHSDIQQMVTQFGWSDEGVAFCAPS